MLRYVLLGMLADGQPLHGYALMKVYGARSGFRLSIGNVYRELQRLLGEGLIATATNPEGADPRRTPYTITAAGRDALAAWLEVPAEAVARAVPDPLAHRLSLLEDVDPPRVEAFLEDLHAELWVQTKTVERERATVSRHKKDGDRIFPTRVLLLDRRAKHLATDIELVDQMRDLLSVWMKRAGAKAARVAAQPVDGSTRRQKQKPRAKP